MAVTVGNGDACDFLRAVRSANLFCGRFARRAGVQCVRRHYVVFVGSPMAVQSSREEWKAALEPCEEDRVGRVELHFIACGNVDENRRHLMGLSSLPGVQVSLLSPPIGPVSLMQQPWVEKSRITNPFLLFQRALGVSPPPPKPTEEEVIAKGKEAQAQLERKNKEHNVPAVSFLRAGQNFSTGGTSKLVVDVVSADGTSKKLTYELDDDSHGEGGGDADRAGEYRIITRGGKAYLLMQLRSFRCGKCIVTDTGGGKLFVSPRGKVGVASVCMGRSGELHWIWVESASGAIVDDVIVNAEFALEWVPDQPKVVVLHNRLAASSGVPASGRDDFFVDGRI